MAEGVAATAKLGTVSSAFVCWASHGGGAAVVPERIRANPPLSASPRRAAARIRSARGGVMQLYR